MSMTDPIADMLTRIRNGLHAEHAGVTMPGSRLKCEIAAVLKEEGYIRGFEVQEVDGRSRLSIELKYYRGRPVIDAIARISKPGRRVYRSIEDFPVVSGGLGIAIVSTSKGVMTAKKAKLSGVGGEVLCTVS